MKSLLFAILLTAIYGLTATGQDAGQQATQPVVVYQTPMIWQPPPVIYRPQVQWVPYQLQRVEATPWRTPLRSLFWGPMRMTPVYAPQVQQ